MPRRFAAVSIGRVVPRFDDLLADSFLAVDHVEALENLFKVFALLLLALNERVKPLKLFIDQLVFWRNFC